MVTTIIFILHFFEKYYFWWIQMCKRQMWPLVQCCVNILSFNRESQERQEIAVFDLWLPQNCSSLWRLLKTYRRKKKLACLLVYRTTGWGRLKLKYLWASVQEYFYCLSTRYVIVGILVKGWDKTRIKVLPKNCLLIF